LAGQFIQLYIDRFDRWRSPKCLAGESYGGIRAARLLPYLYENFGIEIDGLLLISPALDLSIIHADPANDLPHMLFVPSYAATAWYHKKIGPEFHSSLTEVLAEAQSWTIEQYLPALAKGSQLPGADKDRIAVRLASLTGLQETFIRNQNLRIPGSEFRVELLRSEGLSLGLMDGRRTLKSRSGGFLDDPSMALTIGPYTAVLNEYISDVLHFSPGIPYIFFSLEANSGWNWGSVFSGNDAVESIRRAMSRNRRLKILATAGYFDLNIPYFATAYIMDHIGIDPEMAANIKVRFFPGGHMFYTNSETLEGFAGDAAQFFTEITER
jgi:carboxypeptidase C (cathepsin A)